MYLETGTGSAVTFSPASLPCTAPDQRVPHARAIAYDQDYGYRVAQTIEDNEAAWQLRYRVYCEETGYLPRKQDAGAREVDQYDAHARQSLVFHEPSGLLAGAVRLILPRVDAPHHALPALACAPALAQHLGQQPDIGIVAEISRFSIDTLFRDGIRASRTTALAGYSAGDALPRIMLGLILACLDMAASSGAAHTVAIIDQGLRRLLKRQGVAVQVIGETVDFHGLRQPVVIDMVQTLRNVVRRYPAETHPCIRANVAMACWLNMD